MSCNNKITLADLDEMTAEEIVALLPPDFLEREAAEVAAVFDDPHPTPGPPGHSDPWCATLAPIGSYESRHGELCDVCAEAPRLPDTNDAIWIWRLADVEDALDPIEAYKRDPQNAASDRYKRIAARAEDAQVGR